jgi:hypothetical protein
MNIIIQPNPQSRLRHREHLQFIRKSLNAVIAHDPVTLNLDMLSSQLAVLVQEEETAMSVETGSTLTGLREASDLRRNRSHSALFNYTKTFTYNDDDAKACGAAQRIMRIIRQVGNPWNVSDQAKTSLITELINELKPYAADIEGIGAKWLVDKLAAANLRYTELDERYHKEKSNRPSGNVSAVRQKITPVYNSIIGAINADAVRYPDGRFNALAAELNTIIKEFNALMAQRKAQSNSEDKEANGPQADEPETDTPGDAPIDPEVQP